MTYGMILTPEQEQRRKDSKQAIESLKYNPMCYNCKKLCAGCNGTVEKVWNGCIWYKKADFPSVYALAAYAPELIKNEDWFSFDEFLDDLRSDRAEVVKHLKWRAAGHHFLNEVLTDKYITACEKILNILKTA
jgi:hypothetical protein